MCLYVSLLFCVYMSLRFLGFWDSMRPNALLYLDWFHCVSQFCALLWVYALLRHPDHPKNFCGVTESCVGKPQVEPCNDMFPHAKQMACTPECHPVPERETTASEPPVVAKRETTAPESPLVNESSGTLFTGQVFSCLTPVCCSSRSICFSSHLWNDQCFFHPCFWYVTLSIFPLVVSWSFSAVLVSPLIMSIYLNPCFGLFSCLALMLLLSSCLYATFSFVVRHHSDSWAPTVDACLI